MTEFVEAKCLHDDVSEYLQTQNTLDLSTLPTARERESLQNQIKNYLTQNHTNLSETIKDRVKNEFFSCGPIEKLIEDPTITEIIINGQNSIWYEKAGQLHVWQDKFFSQVSFHNFIHRITADSKIQANLDHPYADGFWRQFRVHLIIPPLAQGGAHLSLRRHPDCPWTFSRLAEAGWAPPDALCYLKELLHQQKSFLIVGPTGSGKTSVLSACLQELNTNERIVTIEDSSEIHLPNPVSVKLLTRHDHQGILKSVDQSELLKQSLRMRPDRIVMGEVRGAEAKDLLMALSTGHKGGMGTLHADSAKQALYRLEMLVQMGAPQWSLRAIRHLIYFGLHAIVCVTRTNGVRKLESINRITSLEETGFCLEKVKV
jgi:pilus assembly protein CpaF